LEHRHLR